MTIYSRGFWAAAGERAAKTFVQFALVIYGGNLVDALTLDWVHILGLSLSGLILSVLFSLGSMFTGQPGPSLTTETVARVGRHERRDADG